jgi:hypothetical protein
MHILFEERAGHTVAVMGHVSRKGFDNASSVNTSLRKSCCQIDEVAAFVALIHGAQFRAEQFFKLVGWYLATAFEPV